MLLMQIARPLRYSVFKKAQGNIKCHNPACLSALAESNSGNLSYEIVHPLKVNDSALGP